MLSSYLAHVLFGIKHITGLPGFYGNTVTMATRELCNNESILNSNLAHMFFVIIASMVSLVVLETLLPWQPKNCTVTQLFERILSAYLAHMYFEIIHIADIPGCY